MTVTSTRTLITTPFGSTSTAMEVIDGIDLWIYGLGGIIIPFVGIKVIDLVIHNLLGA